jgi:autotransporter-associated beta strand protein
MGTGNLTLNVANTYSGGTTINTGTFVIGHASAAGSGTITQTDATSLLKIDTTGTISNAMSVHNVLATQSAALSGAITVNNASFEVDAGDTLTISGNVSGVGGVTKNGAGTLTLNGTNTYNGATVVNSGTLEAASAHALGSNNTIQVNGGTLLVSMDDAINGMNITLGNNTTSTVGTLSFTSNYSGNIGTLTLSQDSILDMGENLSVVAAFASIANLNDYILKVYNWDGSSLWGGGTGNDDDRLYFGSGVAGELDQISFYSGFGTGFLGTGFDLGFKTGFGNQIIPVPEPETWATAVLLVLGGAVWLWRKQSKFKKSANSSD